MQQEKCERRINVRVKKRWGDSQGENRRGKTKVSVEKDFTRRGARIKYFNHRLSCYENAFDPDSKALLQNKYFFELAAAQWDSLKERVQKKTKKKNFPH